MLEGVRKHERRERHNPYLPMVPYWRRYHPWKRQCDSTHLLRAMFTSLPGRHIVDDRNPMDFAHTAAEIPQVDPIAEDVPRKKTPEVMAMARRNGNLARHPYPCPRCTNGRLMDTGPDRAVELIAINDGDLPWQPDFFIKCHRCKSEFGVRKINSTKTDIAR